MKIWHGESGQYKQDEQYEQNEQYKQNEQYEQNEQYQQFYNLDTNASVGGFFFLLDTDAYFAHIRAYICIIPHFPHPEG